MIIVIFTYKVFYIDGKLTILTKEEFESIDNDISNYEEQIEKLNKSINELTNQNKSQKDSYEDKINSLTRVIESKSQIENELKNLKGEFASLQNKSKSYQKENLDLNLKIQNLSKSLDELKNENKKISKENFEKFESINSFQKEVKIKAHTISTLESQIKDLEKAKNELEKSNKEIENNATMSKIFYENQNTTLRKQIEQISKSNQILLNENSDLQSKVKEFQTYTNMAKVNTSKLEKKDFSVLEAMSQRVSKAEANYEKIKNINNELEKENLELKKKVQPLENLVLLYMKNENENETNKNRNGTMISKEELKEIEMFKNNYNDLFMLCVNLKNTNLMLQQEMQNITVECNKRLRELKK